MHSRRSFLRQTAALSAGAWIAPRIAIGKAGPSANTKINIACIGAGGRGAINIQGLAAENIVALCDVDHQYAADTFKAYPQAKAYKDFRRMLDELHKDIDAVLISTPDHTHFAATMAAMELGKHVFCEKPLAHTIWEVRTMKRAAAHYRVINQMGNQGHSTDGIRSVKEWIDADTIGQAKEITAWLGPIDFSSRFFRKPDAFPPAQTAIPAHLDWDLWLGPTTRKVPYHPIYHPRTWRGFYEFGGGLLGDWACHTLDAPFWALGLGMPTAVEIEKQTGGSYDFCPDQSTVRFEFPARGTRPAIILRWHEGPPWPEIRPEWGLKELPASGMIITGEKGHIMTGERPDSPRLLPEETWLDFRKNPVPKTLPRIKGGHYREWTNAIRGDGPAPGSDFAYGADLTEMTLLGVLAQRFGGRIEYEAERMEITNRPELNAYLKTPAREGWIHDLPQ